MAITSVKEVKSTDKIINDISIEQKNSMKTIENEFNNSMKSIQSANFSDSIEEIDLSEFIEKKPATNIDPEKAERIVNKYKGRKISSLSNKEFIEYIGAAAQLAYFKDGILPSVTIAQAIEESGWGEYAIGNNLFGIKKSKKWKGKTIKKKTKEFVDGEEIIIEAEFKDYDSIIDGIKDHNKLLNESWFSPVKKACKNNDPYEACRQLEKCEYATNPEYDSDLISIIKKYNLTRFDP